jgi:hypothetical protein
MAVLAQISHVVNAQGAFAPMPDKSNVEEHKEVALSYSEDGGETVSGAIGAEVSAFSTEGLRATNHISGKTNIEQALQLENLCSTGEITGPRKRQREGNTIDDIFNPLL